MAPDGRLLSLLGHADTTWSGVASQWNLGRSGKQKRRGAGSPTSRPKPWAGIAPSRIRLAKGIDHWWSTLDGAVGVDVYGHNGLAVGYYDGDGLEDLYVCQPAGLPNRLYHNNGDATFTDPARAAGLDIVNATLHGPLRRCGQ